jgi:3-oxoacid CoA-transferase subunit A/glutaconate CoA-transferase subunit A
MPKKVRRVLNLKVIDEGHGELHAWMDPDDARAWMAEKKSRQLSDKVMTLKEAVNRFTFDGGYLAMGGFGHVRVSMAGIYEMIRQNRRNLVIAGKTAVHDVDILIASGVVDRVECAYSFGHELRGLSPAGRRAVEGGSVKVVAELSNAAFQWRFKAAAMGLPWLPARVMMGTDTFNYSSSKVVEDPYTGKPICLIPACYPDFAFVHVHRCDRYGNAQIDGTVIEDKELAMAAKRLIVTTEELVSEEEIRAAPDRTVIPFFIVDAVCKVPYGSHPGNMPLLYYSDEEHMAEWLSLSKTEEGVKQYLDKYVYSVNDLAEYISLVGGEAKMEYLRRLERLEEPLKAPWAKR